MSVLTRAKSFTQKSTRLVKNQRYFWVKRTERGNAVLFSSKSFNEKIVKTMLKFLICLTKKLNIHRSTAEASIVVRLFTCIVGVIFAISLAIVPAYAQTLTVGDFDIYINDKAGFTALGAPTIYEDPTGLPNVYASDISLISSFAISSGSGAFAVSGTSTALSPGNGASVTGTVQITDLSPVNGLGFSIVDIFDHGSANTFEDIITFSANGVTLFTLSDGKLIGAGSTGSVDVKDPAGNLITTVTQGQAVATFIGIVNNNNSTISNIGIAYDYKRVGAGSGEDLHGIDQFITVVLPVINAIDDDFTGSPINSQNGGSTTSVISLDTLDGVQNPTIGTNPGEIKLYTTLAQDNATVLGLDNTPVSGSIIMNNNGTITIAENTTVGTYNYSYQICEITNPTNCDIAVATIEIEPSTVDLEITKTVSNETPNIGDTVTFYLLVKNIGPDTALDTSVTDVVPAGFTYVAGTMTGISPVIIGITADEANPISTGLEWTIDSLTAGSSVNLEFQTLVKAP